MALADSLRAIGAVTRLLQEHLAAAGFLVSVGKPEDAASRNTSAKLNLFLYETAADPHLRNIPLHEGEPPPLWLVLRFLLTAFDADESSDTAAAHELLGSGMATLYRLNYLSLAPPVDVAIRSALEYNPEPLKLTFDESGPDLLSKLMQGNEERYRLSAAFQVRPVMIVPGTPPRASLLVGVDYTTTPETIIGRDGVNIDVLPSLGTVLERVEPDRFEAGTVIRLFGRDFGGDLEVMLGNVMLTLDERRLDHLVVTVEGSPGAPIADGTALSAGETPLLVRRRLDATHTRSSNLLPVRLLPLVTGALLAAGDLELQGVLLGTATDDVIVVMLRAADGVPVHRFDTFDFAADQQTLTVQNATAALPAGSYRAILLVNGQQAKASPLVVVP
ncbi:Pvc16 family protein [Massilia sp. METH4]|uniref:Pvc16 family protein n=1 Tax=Massilia sp. METH4 TaxID=3123041 RepID=UPI0030CF1B57